MATTTYTPSMLRNGTRGIPEIPAGSTPPSFNNTYSLAFDGVDDVLETPVLAPIETQLWTLSTWVKWNNLTGSNEAIFSTRQNGLASSTGFDLYITDSGGNLRARTYKGNGIGAQVIISTSTYGITTGIWYNIVCIYNSGTLSVSINDGTVFSGSASGNYTASGVNPTIGKWRNGSGYHDGNIDEVAIWGTDETANISTISTSPVVDLTSLNPVAWYRNGDNGTWKSPQWLIPNNENKTKFSNYSFSYDGVDDYIDLGSITFDATNGLTMSCWIKYDGVGAGLNWLCSNGNTGGVSTQFNTRLSATGAWFNYFLGSASYTGITGLNDGNWHHIAQTVNYSNGDVKFYKDGVVSATILTYGSTYSTAIVKQISTSFFPFKGQIDEFAVFESIENIADLYNGGVPSDLSSLSPVGYWRSENSTFSTNWTVTDNGSGGNNGTSANMTIEDRVGDAPNSTSNALSYNMDEVDRETDVPT